MTRVPTRITYTLRRTRGVRLRQIHVATVIDRWVCSAHGTGRRLLEDVERDLFRELGGPLGNPSDIPGPRQTATPAHRSRGNHTSARIICVVRHRRPGLITFTAEFA